MEALKHAEHLVGVPHVKADAVIADEDHWLAVHGRLPYFNDAPFAWPGELEGIRQQVGEDLLDQAWIALHKWQRTNLPVDLPVLRFRSEVQDNLLDECIQPGNFHGQCLAANPGQIQEVVHQASHVLRGLMYALQVLLRRRVHLRSEVLQKDFGKAVDMSQRGTQVVRDPVSKGRQLFVGCFQFSGELDAQLLGRLALAHLTIESTRNAVKERTCSWLLYIRIGRSRSYKNLKCQKRHSAKMT